MDYKVIVAGGRDFDDYHLLSFKLDHLLQDKVKTHTITIISGAANGADKLGERYAKDRGYKVKRFPAEWDKYGKSAGFRRNAEMSKVADALVAFWDEASKGTKHMIDLASKENLTIRVIKY